MRHLDLFSGIGGFALAMDWAFEGGVEHTFCDNNKFCQQILKKHWPKSKIYGDIRDIHNETADIITGGFPCQPFSQAGRRRGTEDDRYLWPEMLRVIREFGPRWVIAENVGGLVTWNGGMVLEQVHTDLETAGYEVQAFIIPAVSVNAPHRRDRIWFVANRNTGGIRRHERSGNEKAPTSCGSDSGNAQNSEYKSKRNEKQRRNGERASNRIARSNKDASITESGQFGKQTKWQGWQDTQRGSWQRNWLEVATQLCRMDDGLPRRLDRNARLKALGNSIVPQVAYEIFKAIREVEQ